MHWAAGGVANAAGQSARLDASLGREVAAGLAALERGEPESASRAFNAALNQRPDDAHLHVLNGLAYHLMAAGGDRARLDLAETGYQVARQIDPGNIAAARLLGRLYLESQRFAQAKDMFAEAILLDGGSSETLHGLAVAAYYTGDPALALWAVDQTEAAGGGDALVARTAALVNAAAGNADAAAAAFARYAAVEPNPDRRRHVGRRLDQWRATLAAWSAAPPRRRPGARGCGRRRRPATRGARDGRLPTRCLRPKPAASCRSPPIGRTACRRSSRKAGTPRRPTAPAVSAATAITA